VLRRIWQVPETLDRLDSWKEIAAYMKKGVRTVQRWEQQDGLPVHRLGIDRPGQVFAYRSELDSWWRDRSNRPAASRPVLSRWVWAAVPLLLIAAFYLFGRRLPPAPLAPPVPKPLTAEHGSENYPSFSPDGEQLAYAARAPSTEKSPQPSHLYVKQTGGDSRVQLTFGPHVDFRPAWSPDGRTIAFFRVDLATRKRQTMQIPALGGNPTAISDALGPSILTWTADSKWLLTAVATGQAWRIAALSPVSGETLILTPPSTNVLRALGVSTDRRVLYFVESWLGGGSVRSLDLKENWTASGPPRGILALPQTVMDAALRADQKEVIFSSGTVEEGIGLYRQTFDPVTPRQVILQTKARYLAPAVSRDGRRIAFASMDTHRVSTWRLSLTRPGAEPLPLLTSTHSDQNPSYSPDGRSIVFESSRSGASDLWVSDAEGKQPRRITFTNGPSTASARWSPDGHTIAFESNHSGQWDVYTVSASGGPIRRMTDAPVLDAFPSYSRDGRTLYFMSERTGRREIWKMPSQGGPAEQVTFDGGAVAFESMDGKYLYYTQRRDAAPLWRKPVSGGPAVQIAPVVLALFFTVGQKGAYFVSNPREISLWNEQSGKVGRVHITAGPVGIGLSISPGDEHLLFTQREGGETDLYWLELH